MKKALSIFLSILMILCSCTGFAASALANNFSSEIDIQKALDKNKYDSSTPLTVTVEGTYILSSRLVVYSNTTLNCEVATFIKNYQNSTMLAIGNMMPVVESLKTAPLIVILLACAKLNILPLFLFASKVPPFFVMFL